MIALTLLASVYGAGAYDSANYDGTNAANAASTGGGLLSNTGLDIMIIATAAAVLLLTAIVVRVIRRKPTNNSAQ